MQAALVKQIQDAEKDLRVNSDARVKELTKVIYPSALICFIQPQPQQRTAPTDCSS